MALKSQALQQSKEMEGTTQDLNWFSLQTELTTELITGQKWTIYYTAQYYLFSIKRPTCCAFWPTNGYCARSLVKDQLFGGFKSSFVKTKRRKSVLNGKITTKRVCQYLGATCKHLSTPKCWATPMENIIFLDFPGKYNLSRPAIGGRPPFTSIS